MAPAMYSLCPSFQSLLNKFGFGSTRPENNFFTDRGPVFADFCLRGLYAAPALRFTHLYLRRCGIIGYLLFFRFLEKLP